MIARPAGGRIAKYRRPRVVNPPPFHTPADIGHSYKYAEVATMLFGALILPSFTFNQNFRLPTKCQRNYTWHPTSGVPYVRNGTPVGTSWVV